MTNIILNSFILHCLIRSVKAIHDNYRKGLIYRMLIGLNKYYQQSVTRRLWTGFCSVQDYTRDSLYARFMTGLRRGAVLLGRLLEGSFFYRILIGIKGIYLSLSSESFLLSCVNKLGLRQWMLVAFVLYLPIEYVIRDLLGGSFIASVWEELFIIIAFIMVFWRRALNQTNAIKRETPLDAYLILFISIGLLLMSAVNPYPAVALAGYRAVVEYMVWFFLIIRLIEDDRDFKIVYYTFIAMGALICLHGIYQYIIAVPIPAAWVSQTEMGVRTRVFSLTGSPNILGSLIVLIAPLAASMIYYSGEIWKKLSFFLITSMMCLCLLFTFSRGAWVGIVIAVIIFSLYVDRRLLGLMAAAMAGVLVFIPSITSRLTYLFTSDYAEASAIGGRALRWETGRMLLLENNPWLGFGLGRFGGAVAMNNKLLDETEEFSYFYMDNYYLKTMVEMGYIGIFFFIILILALIIWGLRSIYRAELESGCLYSSHMDPVLRWVRNPKILAVGIFSGLCGVLVHCYFENIFEEPYMMAYFWGLAAMLIYLGFYRFPRR